MDRFGLMLSSTQDTLIKEATRTGTAQVSAIEADPTCFALLAAVPVSKKIAWASPAFDSIDRKLQDAMYDAVGEVYGSEQYLDIDGSKLIRIQEFHGFFFLLRIGRPVDNVGALLRSFETRANRVRNG